MSLLNPIFKWYFSSRYREIEENLKNPLATQERTLLNLVDKAQNTEWGKAHNFSNISDYNSFRKNVPVTDYETLKPYIHRIMEGEQNVLWPTKIQWFAKSSGTTHDKSKFIPVSPESLEGCHYKAGKDLYAQYLHNFPNNNLFKGKGLVMGGSHDVSKINKNAYYGDLSAVLLENTPWWAGLKRLPSYEAALMEDWEQKIDRIANETLNQKVTHILGVPTWTVVLIQRLFEITGKNNLADIWPDIELYIHGGVSFTPYRELFKDFIRKDQMNYMESFNASEGFFAIQDQPKSNELLLMLDYGIYYEFLPVDEVDKEDPQPIPLSEVETEQNYAMVISTNAGLWRYIIGDTIKFTSTNPYRIQVTGRTRFFINAFGEEVILENVEKAFDKACRETNAIISEYTGGPVYIGGNQRGAHEYLIEFEKNPYCLKTFRQTFDMALKEINSDYEAKRYKDLALSEPEIKTLSEGTFYHWMKKRGKLGGQNKVPRLANHREYLEDILSFTNGQQ